MKKVYSFLAAGSLVMLAACGGNKAAENDTVTVDSVEVVEGSAIQ